MSEYKKLSCHFLFIYSYASVLCHAALVKRTKTTQTLIKGLLEDSSILLTVLQQIHQLMLRFMKT